MRLLSFPQLRSEKGLVYSRRHLRRLELAGRFPRSVAISEGRIAWIESEVDSWIADKVARRDDGSAVRLPHSGIAAKAAPAPEVAPARSPRARTRDKVSAGQGPASGG